MLVPDDFSGNDRTDPGEDGDELRVRQRLRQIVDDQPGKKRSLVNAGDTSVDFQVIMSRKTDLNYLGSNPSPRANFSINFPSNFPWLSNGTKI